MTCILVVEHDHCIRELLVDVLAAEGFEIIEADTAEAAVPSLHQKRVRLIVTDINLPGRMNGIGLAEAARKESPGIPIVFISGSWRPAKLADGRPLGAPAMFIQKPFNLNSLVANVQGLIAAGLTYVG